MKIFFKRLTAMLLVPLIGVASWVDVLMWLCGSVAEGPGRRLTQHFLNLSKEPKS